MKALKLVLVLLALAPMSSFAQEAANPNQSCAMARAIEEPREQIVVDLERFQKIFEVEQFSEGGAPDIHAAINELTVKLSIIDACSQQH